MRRKKARNIVTIVMMPCVIIFALFYLTPNEDVNQPIDLKVAHIARIEILNVTKQYVISRKDDVAFLTKPLEEMKLTKMTVGKEEGDSLFINIRYQNGTVANLVVMEKEMIINQVTYATDRNYLKMYLGYLI